MHNDKHKQINQFLNYYAKIFVVVGFALLVYGFILDINNDVRLVGPDVKVVDDGDSQIFIGSSGNDGLVDDDANSSQDKPSGEIKDNGTTNNGSDNNSSGNISVGGSSFNNSEKNVTQLTAEEENDIIRKNIESAYGIKVYYGVETNGYVVGGMGTTPIMSDSLINASLNTLNTTLGYYPDGFFQEIRDGGIPLTIYLIDYYSTPNVTGVTDSNYSFANISIALRYGFEDSFYHESFHYLERYMNKKGLYFNNWNAYNPAGFNYGNKNSNYSYYFTSSPDSFFVNDYAQTNEFEDRASTFEYMMANTKASCLNSGRNVWKKATVISTSIEAVMDSVSSSRVERWERYL